MQELELYRQDQCAPTQSLRKDLRIAQRSSLCPADIFIFQSGQEVHQQKRHSLGRKMDGEPMVSKVNSQICSREAGNWLLHTSSPVPDSPHRSHGIILGHPLSFPVPHQADESQLEPTSRGPIW